MIADMHSNKKHNLVVTEMLIRRRKFKKSYLIIHRIVRTSSIFTKRYSTKPYCVSVIDATLASENPSSLRKNILEKI